MLLRASPRSRRLRPTRRPRRHLQCQSKNQRLKLHRIRNQNRMLQHRKARNESD